EEDTGRPVLVDFGLARSIERTDRLSKSRSTVGAGTPWYMAPEQADEQTDPEAEALAISPRTDVYALGCTAFELFTARPPFDSIDPDELMHSHVHEKPPLISSIRKDLARFDEVIARALAKIPSRRYDSPTEFVEALDALATDDEAQSAPLSHRSQLAEGTIRRDAVRALIVTDDDLFLQLGARALQLAVGGAPITVTSADSELEAATIAQWNPPQIMLLDADAAGLRAVETLSRIRAMPQGAEMRAIVLSERKPEDERWRFECVGVRDYVHKPAELRELVSTIEGTVKRAGWLRRDGARD
ncbi:MAG: response regulator, partial [Polyangiales bacterium]